MTRSCARYALATVLALALMPASARAQNAPQPAARPEPRPQTPARSPQQTPAPPPQTPAPAPQPPAPSPQLPTPGVNPAEGLPADQLSPVENEELFSDPDAMTEGTNVRLENLVVRAKSGLLLRASYDGHEIFVAPVDPSILGFIAIGARIDVLGTLVPAPSKGQAQLEFAMGAREARRLARARVYVDAWSVTTR